jgi:hypothetical protein
MLYLKLIGDIMKKYNTIVLCLILLVFILVSCSALVKTTAESTAAVTTDTLEESLITDIADNTEISIAEDTNENGVINPPITDPNVVTEDPFPVYETDPKYNVPFDLTPYFIETKPVIDAYNFNIISQYYSDYLDSNNFVLPKLISDKAGAVALNNKIIDDFLSKMSNRLNKLSDIDILKQIKVAKANYSYTVNDGIIIILLNTSVYGQGSDAGETNQAVYYYRH